VRDVAIAAMGKIGSPEALSHLFSVLRTSADSEMFGQCLRAIGEALEFQPNEDALRNIGDWTRLASAATAGELDTRLKSVLADDSAPADSGETRKAAAMIVRALRLRPLYTSLVLAGRDPSLRGVLEFSAVSLGDEIVPALMEGLHAPGATVRELACECLGAMGHKPAAPSVATLLADGDHHVRAAAVSALMRLGHDAATPAIAELLKDADAAVREAAIAALGRMDVEAVAAALRPFCADPAVHKGTLLTIMRVNPHPSHLGFIRECLADPSPVVRRTAAEALARQAGQDLGSALASLLDDPETEVRAAVVQILGGVHSARARQLLVRQLQRDPATRPGSVRALSLLRDSSLIPLLYDLFQEDAEADETVGAIVPDRIAIVEALSGVDDPALEQFLARQLGSRHESLRRAAVFALARIGSPTAFRQLGAAARDAHESVREAVAEALSRAGTDPGEHDILTRLSVDQNRKVALVARQALERRAQSAAAGSPPG
jgi:HEAT repeat protein